MNQNLKKNNMKEIEEKLKEAILITDMIFPNDEKPITKYIYKNNRHHTKVVFPNIAWEKRFIMCDMGSTDDISSNLTSDKYIPQHKDKIFFGADCTIPRNKVREWGKLNNISITIKPEKANVNVISRKWFSSLFDNWTQTYYKNICKDNFIEFIEENYDATTEDISELIKEIKESSHEHLLLRTSGSVAYTKLIGSAAINRSYYHSNKGWEFESKEERKESGCISTYTEMHGDKELTDRSENDFIIISSSENKIKEINKFLGIRDDSTIIYDTSLIDIINQNAVNIDNEMDKQLRAMLSSDNAADIVLAMEIIANCNYKTSLHKILLIFRNHGGTCWARKERNHINFKSLTKFIDLRDWTNPSYDEIIHCLMNKNYLTNGILKEIFPLVKEEMNKDNDRMHSIFKINTITVNNDVKRYFGVKVPLSENEQKLINENI